MREIRELSNYILHTKLWIAACAAAQCIYTYDLFTGFSIPGQYTLIVFCATLFLYASHQYIGWKTGGKTATPEKASAAGKLKVYIILYALLGLGLSVYFFLQMEGYLLQYILLPPVCLSLAYILPVFGKGRRLRDFAWIKIFLIAVTWAYLVVVVPMIDIGITDWHVVALAFGERTFLFLAVTIPSDVRDRTADSSRGLKTIATNLGFHRSRQLAIILLCLSAALNLLAISLHYYPGDLALPYALFFLIALALLSVMKEDFGELYFGGLIDGCVFILPFLYWLMNL